MFWLKKKKAPATLESVLGVEDRGPVRDFYRGGRYWHSACSKCCHRVHIVWDGEEAKYACPVCLSFIKDDGDDGDGKGEKKPVPVKPEAKRPPFIGGSGGPGSPTGKNRIEKYFKSDGGGPRRGPGEPGVSDIPPASEAWGHIFGMDS